jgi:tetratricopeptide (TPR) repeat protein
MGFGAKYGVADSTDLERGQVDEGGEPKRAATDGLRSRRGKRFAEPALGLSVLFGSVLLVGGVLPWTVVSLVLTTLAWLVLTHRRGALRIGVPALVLLACAALATLQCVPLPRAWLAFIDPVSAEIWARTNELLRVQRWAPLSLDPEATRLEALKALLYAGVWVGAAALRRRFGLRVVLIALCALALVAGGLTGLHALLGMSKVYGVYQPEYAYKGNLGPLLNPNSLGGLMVLGAFAGLGFAIHQQTSKLQALFAWGAVSVALAMVVLSGSRGALLGLAVGVAVLFTVTRKELAKSFGGPKSNIVQGAFALVAAVGLILAAMTATLLTQLWDGSLEKARLWLWGWNVALEHPWFGVGRGAFGAEVGRIGGGPGEVVFIHAENWAMEWVAGFGLIFGGALVVAFLRLLWPAGADQRWKASDFALWSGLIAVSAQNLTDLSFEVPGLAVPLVFALAAGSERTKGPGHSAAHGRKGVRRWAPGLGLASALGVGALWVIAYPVQLAHRERSALSARFWAGAEAVPTLDELGAAVARHPADAYLLRLGAQRLLQEDPARGIAWLNASLLQAPRAGRTYVLLAQSLMRLGRKDQALVSLREAARHSPELSATVAELATRWSGDGARRAVPEGIAGARVLLELAGRVPSSEQRVALIEEARQRDPVLVGVDEALIDAKLAASVRGEAPCGATQREQCLAQADEALAALELRGTTSIRIMLRGRLYLAQGKVDEACAWLTARCPRTPEGRSCLELLLTSAARKDTAAVSAAAELLVSSCGTRRDCASALRAIAQVFRSRGESLLALSYHERVAQTDPSWSSWLDLALLAKELGRAAEAERWFERAAQDAMADPVAVQKVNEARQRATPR